MSKDERSTLDKILLEAKNEFLSKGYTFASLREIVKKAGVTTGAFYGYFKNKEQLFDALVEEQYSETLKMYHDTLETFFNIAPEEQCENMAMMSYRCMLKLKDYMYEHYDAFKLILCCSQGTKYQNLVIDLAQMDVQANHDFAMSMEQCQMETKGIHPVLEQILTSSMFTSFFALIVHDVPKEDADAYISQLLDFFTAGWGKIMGF